MKSLGFSAARRSFKAALVGSALALGGLAALAGPASADPLKVADAPIPFHGRDGLAHIPVFFIADSTGRPVVADPAAGPSFYVNRTQAALALGYARGERKVAMKASDDLHLRVTDMATAYVQGPAHFVKPPTPVEAAADMTEAPLYLVRDKSGSPYTLRGTDGRNRVYFFLSENDALDFIGTVMESTKAADDDVRLSLVPLSVVLKSLVTKDTQEIRNWAIWSNAQAREDAAVLRADLAAQSAQLPTAKP